MGQSRKTEKMAVPSRPNKATIHIRFAAITFLMNAKLSAKWTKTKASSR